MKHAIRRMMNTALALLSALTLAGCPARSVQPLFSLSDVRFTPDLIGTWAVENERYVFERGDDDCYRVEYMTVTSTDGASADSVSSTTFIVRAGVIDGTWFFDSTPAKGSDDFHMISTHLIMKVRFDADTMFLSFLEADWLQRKLEDGTVVLPHITYDDEILITASTQELQHFVSRFASDADAFPNPGKFVRLR